jgi:hypothetical protein
MLSVRVSEPYSMCCFLSAQFSFAVWVPFEASVCLLFSWSSRCACACVQDDKTWLLMMEITSCLLQPTRKDLREPGSEALRDSILDLGMQSPNDDLRFKAMQALCYFVQLDRTTALRFLPLFLRMLQLGAECSERETLLSAKSVFDVRMVNRRIRLLCLSVCAWRGSACGRFAAGLYECYLHDCACPCFSPLQIFCHFLTPFVCPCSSLMGCL